MSDKLFVGLGVTSVEDNGTLPPISRVTLMVDDNNAITAGDDTGREIVADCPFATQEMVNAILARLKGYQYHAYTASDAGIDPAVELGDAVTVDGIYSVVSRIEDDGTGYPSISAPGEAELEDEYPSVGPVTQTFNRQISETRSLISKTSEEILLQVENELEGLSSSFSVQLQQIQSQVTGLDGQMSSITQTVSSITSQVNGLDGQVSTIEQKVDNITLSVSNGSTSSSISLSVGGVTVSSQTIQMNGLVTFTGLANGTTTIDGACIKTGTIEAERLNLTGAITWGDLSNRVQNDIDTALQDASDALDTANDVSGTVDGWSYRYGGTTYIDGTKLMTGTVTATKLQGGQVDLLASNENVVGSLDIAYTTTGYGVSLNTDQGGIQITSGSGNIYIESGRGPFLMLGSEGGSDNICQLGGGPLVISNASYGSRAPSGSGEYGQVYFQLE